MVIDAENRQAFARGLPDGLGRRAKDTEGFAGMDMAIGAAVGPLAKLSAELAQGFQAALQRAVVKGCFELIVHRTITCPPSTTRVCPVMQRAESEHRKIIALATSARLISRFRDVSEL